MRSIIFSFALVSVGATINCSKIQNTDTSKKTPLTEYQIFAQKYEAAFGEKPSREVWNLAADACRSHACAACNRGTCGKQN